MKKEGSSCLHYTVTDFAARWQIFSSGGFHRGGRRMFVPSGLSSFSLYFFPLYRARSSRDRVEGNPWWGRNIEFQVRWYLPPDIWLVCPTSCVTYVPRQSPSRYSLRTTVHFQLIPSEFWTSMIRLWFLVVFFFKFIVLNSYCNRHLWLWYCARWLFEQSLRSPFENASCNYLNCNNFLGMYYTHTDQELHLLYMNV